MKRLRRNLRYFAAAASLTLSAACGSASDQKDTEHNSSPTPTASSSSAFDGAGYRFTSPEGWLTRPGVGSWYIGVSPVANVSGFDTFTSPGGDPWIVIGRRPVGSSVSLERWVRHMTATKTITYPPSICASPEHVGGTQLGGKPAVIRAFHCRGEDTKDVAVQVPAVSGGHGYLAMCDSPEGKAGGLPEFETVCKRLLQGFRFLTGG